MTVLPRTLLSRLLPLAVVCGSFTLASAQGATRDLTGSVRDEHHEPLRGAVVYIEEEGNHIVVTYLTDRSGTFNIKRLRGDADYDVWAVFRGHESKRKTLSQFDTHPNPTINLTIRPE